MRLTKFFVPPPITATATQYLSTGVVRMYAVTTARRLVGTAVRWCVPVLFLATVLGITGGGHDNATVSPEPSAILAEMTSHHDLPRGTRVNIGDPRNPTVLAYDERGRMVMTPPRGQSFGKIVALGFTRMEHFAAE
jgi:hypothetical protein